jgi:hypothetical protein
MLWVGLLAAAVAYKATSALMPLMPLMLKRASASRSSGEWNDDDFDVLADGAVVGHIFKANAAPVGSPWMWRLAFDHHEDRTPTHGHEPTRAAASPSRVRFRANRTLGGHHRMTEFDPNQTSDVRSHSSVSGAHRSIADYREPRYNGRRHH